MPRERGDDPSAAFEGPFARCLVLPTGASWPWNRRYLGNVGSDHTERRHLGIGFRMGKANLRGVTTRGIFEGGPQERALAAKSP